MHRTPCRGSNTTAAATSTGLAATVTTISYPRELGEVWSYSVGAWCSKAALWKVSVITVEAVWVGSQCVCRKKKAPLVHLLVKDERGRTGLEHLKSLNELKGFFFWGFIFYLITFHANKITELEHRITQQYFYGNDSRLIVINFRSNWNLHKAKSSGC